MPTYAKKHNYSDTKSRLRQDRRRQRAASLPVHQPTGESKLICLPGESRDTCISQGLGAVGQGISLIGASNRNNPILGRSPESTSILQGNSTDLIVRPSTGLFIPAFGSGVVSSSGDNSQAGTYTSMVVNTITSPDMRAKLLERLNGIQAVRVVNYLHYSFDCGDEPISINGVYSSLTLLRETFPGFDMLRASEVGPLKFYGGPPNKLGWYYGSLLTILIDKVLCAYTTGKMHVVGRFLNLEI